MLSVAVYFRVKIQPALASDYTDGDIICMYKCVKKEKKNSLICTEDLALHTGTNTVHWWDDTSCISVVESKITTHRVKYIDIIAYFLQE